MDTLGERIKQRRKSAGMTQEDLAYVAGVRLNAIVKLENDKTPNPHWLTIVGVARALELDLEELAESAA